MEWMQPNQKQIYVYDLSLLYAKVSEEEKTT